MEGSSSQAETRRTVLRRGAGALAVSVALAGCTEDVGEEFPPNDHRPVADLVPDLPVRDRRDVLVDGIEDLAAADIDDLESFLSALEERGLEFESVSEVADVLHLEYVGPDLERTGTLAVAAAVAGAYAALVAADFEARALELVLLTSPESPFGVLEIATDWAVEFDEGALSAAAYGELVAGTIESVHEPPEPDVAPEE